MLQSQPQLQKDIQRSLNRLQFFLNQNNNNISDIIPSLYYSTDLLKKYSQSCKPDEVNFAYFHEFKLQLQSFATKDLSAMKQHEKQILDEMLEIVNSDTFTQCLQPEIKSSRIHSQTQASKKKHKKVPQKYPGLDDQYSEVSSPVHTRVQSVKKQSETSEQQLKFQKFHKQKQELFQTLLTAYRQHRIDQAYSLKNQYVSKKYSLSAEQNDLFNTIQLQYNTMISFYKQFDLQGWIFDKEQNGVTLEYKIFEAQKQIAIRIGSQFNVSVQNFLAILTEIDLMGSYIPFTYDSKQLKVISRNEKIGTSKIYIPCLTDRETYFYAAGYDRIKTNGSIFLFSKTINEDKLYQQKYGFKVPQKSDYIRLQYKFFIVEYIPLSKNRAKVRLASKVDMKLNFLPQFILNMSARKFAFDYFKNIIKMNKNFKGSPWEAKIKQNPEFYGFFKSKVEEYMGTN